MHGVAAVAEAVPARPIELRAPGHPHGNCANCLPYAIRRLEKLLADVDAASARGHQEDLFAGWAA